jgi:Tfp pilus assembly protein PilN
MRQQINLYQQGLIDRPKPFAGRQAGLLLLLSLLFVLVLGGYGYWRGVALEPQRAELHQRQQQLHARIADLEQQFPIRQSSPLLQQRIVRLEQEVQDLGQTLDFVLQREQGRNPDMLAALEGLAQRQHAGLWLNQILLARQGYDVELSGRAFVPELVPDYLQWLSDEGVFPGLTFSRLRLSRLQEYPNHVDFTISSRAVGGR